MEEDPYYNDPVNRLLFVYKLNRAFSLDYLSTIFASTNSFDFDYETVTELKKIPDIFLRCDWYCRGYHFEKGDLKCIIDSMFPMIEEIFFTLLTTKYSFKILDMYLDQYLKQPSKDLKNNDSSEQKITLAKALENKFALHYRIHYRNCDKKLSTKPERKKYNDCTPLQILFTVFIENFKYSNEESLYTAYNLLFQSTPVIYNPNYNIPFTVHNSNYNAMYSEFQQNQNTDKKAFSSFIIKNRSQLLITIANILNDIAGPQ